jgi:hypothetical protein
MAACGKCGNELYECPDCKGQTMTNPFGEPLTCKGCRSTGKLCPTDGKFWT